MRLIISSLLTPQCYKFLKSKFSTYVPVMYIEILLLCVHVVALKRGCSFIFILLTDAGRTTDQPLLLKQSQTTDVTRFLPRSSIATAAPRLLVAR